MSFEIVTSAAFDREAKRLRGKYPSLLSDLRDLARVLIEHPRSGDPLGMGCYKVRMAISSKSRGKSGGARVITTIQVTRERIVLLAIYDKSERSSITKRELRIILDTLS